jgi:hypothetical protein
MAMAWCFDGDRLVRISDDCLFNPALDIADVDDQMRALGLTRSLATDEAGAIWVAHDGRSEVSLPGFGLVSHLIDVEVGGVVETILCRNFPEYLKAMNLCQGHFIAAKVFLDEVRDRDDFLERLGEPPR